jgi:hypothetical protein
MNSDNQPGSILQGGEAVAENSSAQRTRPFTFRSFREGPMPEPNEIFMQAKPDLFGDCRALSCLVLQHGVTALVQGVGPPGRIVISADPTLDEMLAALIVRLLLSGQAMPRGMPHFARYGQVARQGLRPGELAPQQSLEGIYLAVRVQSGKDLSIPDAGQRFLLDWDRMADRILGAAQAGLDPFTTPLFDDDPEFAIARAFLASDHEVYKQDVLHGERWRVRLPGGPRESSGLLLRQPRSLLFSDWSRRDAKALVGHAYLFLALDWGNGDWVFSTDPVLRLSLQPLAERLQQAEAGLDPVHARDRPWFDGKPFQHTLIAAPRGGTKLPNRTVRRIVRRWARAERVRPIQSNIGLRGKILVAAFMGLVACAQITAILLRWLATPPSASAPVEFHHEQEEHGQPGHPGSTGETQRP